MPHQYNKMQQEQVRKQFIANGGDISLTSERTGIPMRTLYNWQKSGILPLLPLPPTLPEDGEKPALWSANDLQSLHELKDEMLHEARNLVQSIESAIPEAPLAQRVIALARLVDRILKLSTQLPSQPFEIEIVGAEEYEPHARSQNENALELVRSTRPTE